MTRDIMCTTAPYSHPLALLHLTGMGGISAIGSTTSSAITSFNLAGAIRLVIYCCIAVPRCRYIFHCAAAKFGVVTNILVADCDSYARTRILRPATSSISRLNLLF